VSTPRAFTIRGSGARAWCLRAALVIAVISGFSLAASGTARAAACADLDDCFNAATWQKAIADDYYKKAFFSGVDAQNNFKAAAYWHNRSVGAFLSGDGNAAQWYQALANDYARKAAASAKAANGYLAQAKFTAAAADYNFRRYVAIANDPDDDGAGAVASSSKIGVKSLKKAKAICKKNWKAALVCEVVKSIGIDSAVRWVWKMVDGRTCLRQVARYNVNPSTGYVEKVYHDCVRWA
jgi:hypothetical protein